MSTGAAKVGEDRANPASESSPAEDLRFVTALLGRISTDLGLLTERAFTMNELCCERQTNRAEGKSRVHISFKMVFIRGNRRGYGCVLIPLPDALTLAACLMFVPDVGIPSHRSRSAPDQPTKDAMVEIANFIGGAADAVVREHSGDEISAKSAGCQGVRANVRPALIFTEGDELIIGRARAQIHDFAAFELIAMLPPMAWR
jgi:hypothetical protein